MKKKNYKHLYTKTDNSGFQDMCVCKLKKSGFLHRIYILVSSVSCQIEPCSEPRVQQKYRSILYKYIYVWN